MNIVDMIEWAVIGQAVEQDRDVNDVMDSVIWELQTRDQEGIYRQMNDDIKNNDIDMFEYWLQISNRKECNDY